MNKETLFKLYTEAGLLQSLINDANATPGRGFDLVLFLQVAARWIALGPEVRELAGEALRRLPEAKAKVAPRERCPEDCSQFDCGCPDCGK